MKKNNLVKDKKILSALTVGISAMLFLQTPISAYAAYEGELGDTSPNNTESDSSQTQDNYEPVTTEAQEEATQAEEACVSQNEVIPATEEAPAIGSAQAETVEAADLIVNGSEENNIEKAGEEFADKEAAPDAINNLIDAAQEVLDDKAEGSEDLSNIEAAAADISGSEDSAKEQIANAENANREADKAYNDAVEAVDKAGDLIGTSEDDVVPGLIKTQENIDGIVNDTNTKGQELVDKIAAAKTEEEIEAAKGELDKLIKESKDDLESQIELFNGLSESFDKAVIELKDAQKALDDADKEYQDALDNAENKTNDAQSKVDIASQKVENLVGAMNDALSAIDAMEAGADDLDATRGNQWQGLFAVSSESSRNVMKQVIKDYYLSQILKIDLVEDEDHQVTFTDPQKNSNYERNYTTVNYYYNEDGEIKQGTRYFNWDSIAKADKAHENHGYNNGINKKEFSSAIVIYEKDEQEANPTAVRDAISESLLRAHEKDSNYFRNGEFMLANEKNITRGRQQGMFRLYSYVDANGNEQQITQFELFGGNPGDLYPELLTGKSYNDQGDLTKVFEKEVRDGKTVYRNQWTGVEYVGLKEVTPDDLVTQNKNGLYKDANCLILGDTETITNVLKGEGGYSYVKANVVDKYGISSEKIDELIEATARLNNYIDNNSTAGINNLKDKYNTYATEVAEAQKAVENAQTRVGELSSAIDELRDKSVKKSKTMMAKDALGVGDIATYFGLTGLDEAQAEELNNLNLAGLISKLSELKKDANDKVEGAKDHLSTVIDDLINKAEEAAVRPAGGGSGASSAGEDAEASTAGDETAQTAAVAVAASAVATNAAPSAAVVLSEDGGAVNADTVQEAPAVQAVADSADGQADADIDAEGGEDIVDIADEGVALADTPDAVTAPEETQETLTAKQEIENAAVALASGDTINNETRKMSWWWLLIIALLGATGKRMYDEHVRKEEEKKNRLD